MKLEINFKSFFTPKVGILLLNLELVVLSLLFPVFIKSWFNLASLLYIGQLVTLMFFEYTRIAKKVPIQAEAHGQALAQLLANTVEIYKEQKSMEKVLAELPSKFTTTLVAKMQKGQ